MQKISKLRLAMILHVMCLASCGVLLAQSSTVTVSVASVDAKNPTITVTYDAKSRQLELARDVVVEIDGKKAEFRSLIPGDEAEVTYDKAQAVVTKIVVSREPILPAEKLPEGWDEIDQRLVFLMVRLANVEASLDAIEDVIGTKDRLANSKLRDAKRADRANEDMDRNAGGPLKWSQFYGTTAEKFFYHPTDRNSSYHTTTVLNQQGSQADNKVGGGVPSSQGLPVHQRPPQFDYIYRSNERAKTRAAAEAAELKGKLDQLAARRQRLEAEQAGLWVEIAFRAIAHYDLDKKPLYRFEPLLLASDTDSRNMAETMKATSIFMAVALSIITEVDRNQAGTFIRIKPLLTEARQELNDSYLRLALNATDRKTSLGRFAALAKRLEDVAANLTDSYVVAMEGDSAKDQQRKETFRMQLQQSLLGYAQIVLAMDEMASELKDQYAYKPDVDKRIRTVGLSSNSNRDFSPSMTTKTIGSQQKTNRIPEDASYFRGNAYKFFRDELTWHEAMERCEAMGGHLATIRDKAEDWFVTNLVKEKLTYRGKLDGVWLGATDKQIEGQWNWIDSTPFAFTKWGPGQPNNKQASEHYLLLYIADDNWSDQPDRSHQHTTFFVCEWEAK